MARSSVGSTCSTSSSGTTRTGTVSADALASISSSWSKVSASSFCSCRLSSFRECSSVSTWCSTGRAASKSRATLTMSSSKLSTSSKTFLSTPEVMKMPLRCGAVTFSIGTPTRVKWSYALSSGSYSGLGMSSTLGIEPTQSRAQSAFKEEDTNWPKHSR